MAGPGQGMTQRLHHITDLLRDIVGGGVTDSFEREREKETETERKREREREREREAHKQI